MYKASNQHKIERCCLCNKKIDKDKTAIGYCQGHAQYEVMQKVKQLQITQLPLL